MPLSYKKLYHLFLHPVILNSMQGKNERILKAIKNVMLNFNVQNFEHLPGDASSRQYTRIGDAHGNTLMVMLLPASQNNSEEFARKTNNAAGATFINVATLFAQNNIAAPTILSYCDEQKVIFLSDLGDLQLFHQRHLEKPKLKLYYEKALIELFKIHQIKANSNIENTFDRTLYDLEFKHFVDQALTEHLKLPMAQTQDIFSELCKLSPMYLSWPTVITHRDYHSKNLMIKDENVYVIDFQDALHGPIFYDLASLLRDSYVSLQNNLQNELIGFYHEMSKEKKMHMGLSLEGFTWSFHLMGLHRNLKAAGRFFYIHQVKNNPNYLRYIPRSLSYVLQTLHDVDQLKILKTQLSPHLEQLIEQTKPYEIDANE